MEYIDICSEDGQPTGAIVDRDTAHREGILHRTSHVWVIKEESGHYWVLLQKRSREKESFPGMYDVSSAGHIPAGSTPQESAIREMQEEIGIAAAPDELRFAGSFRCSYEAVFHGQIFRDNEIRYAYVYQEPVSINDLTLQKSEVDEVRWFPLSAIEEDLQRRESRICVSQEGLETLINYLNQYDDMGLAKYDKLTYEYRG